MSRGSYFTFTGGLALVFFTLKLLGHINWSWWWVLAPFWLPAVLMSVALIGFFVYVLAGEWMLNSQAAKRRLEYEEKEKGKKG